MNVKKIAAVATGIVVGFGAATLAFIPSSSRTEAAIAVIDQKNIEEAVKTAISTANILTEEQKQVAMMLLNTKKLDENVLGKIMDISQKGQQGILDERNARTGIGKANTTASEAWSERMGNVEALLNGQITAYDAVVAEQNRQKALHDTYQDAAKAAKKAEEQNIKIGKDTEELLKTMKNAEGAVQAIQNNTAMNAQQVHSLAQMTNMLNHLVQMEASRYEKETIESLERLNRTETAAKEARALADDYRKYIDSQQ